MSRCDNPGCRGHLGKFPDCIAEALWQLDPDESTGNTDWEAWYGLFQFDAPEDVTLHAWPNVTVTIPTATYIAGEDSRGAVFYTAFMDSEAARKGWAAIEASYSEWLGDDES
jgi:hypothetical protein